MKRICLLLFVFSSFLYAQNDVLDGYPSGQYFYEKGELNFLKDMQNAALENNSKPCENRNEEYLMRWIVFPDSTISFIKDMDSVNIAKNKCAFDFSREIFKYLEGWKPVVHQGKSYSAIAEYMIRPNEIFMYKIDSSLKTEFQRPEYRGGETAFKIQLDKVLNPIFDNYRLEIGNTTVSVSFIIAKDGNMKDIQINHPVFFRIKDDVLNAFRSFKKWKPAMRNGVPYDFRYTVHLNFVL